MNKDQIVKKLYHGGYHEAVQLIEQMAEENERIRQTHISHEAVKILFNSENSLGKDACMGYVLMAMERTGFDEYITRRVMDEMIQCFNDTEASKAAKHYLCKKSRKGRNNVRLCDRQFE